VEALGGRIEVRSGRAQGSRFSVWVPERTPGATLAGETRPNGP
jgi:signal transduction histidine kinase